MFPLRVQGDVEAVDARLDHDPENCQRLPARSKSHIGQVDLQRRAHGGPRDSDCRGKPPQRPQTLLDVKFAAFDFS